MADELCSKCKSPVTLKPRVNVNSTISRLLDPHDITESLLLSDKDIADCDAEIAHLQSQILYVQEQKKLLINYQTELKLYLSPFSQFSDEILNIIFKYTCAENLLQEYPWPEDHLAEPTTYLSLPIITYLPALAISAVCTQWRSLALASPRLWSQLRLEFASRLELTERHDTQLSGFLSTLQLYLDRSADSPLLINLEIKADVEQEDLIPYALSLILDHTHRWKTFCYNGDYDLSRCRGFSDHPLFPILEDLTLEGCDPMMPVADLRYFEHSPKLHTVKTFHVKSVSKLPWSHLTSLDMDADNQKDIDFLHQCTDLTALKLRTFIHDDGPANSGAILLPRLNSFAFVCNGIGSLKNAFHIFTFPSLTELIVQLDKDREFQNFWPAHTFSTFISRSSCNLTTLSISHVIISDLDFIASFRLLPSLNNLAIEDVLDSDDGSPITSRLISCMHASFSPPLLPKLRSLSMEINDTSCDDSALVDMVASRWLPNPLAVVGIDCLRSLVLHFIKREMAEGPYKLLECLDAVGMRVVVIGKSTVGR